MGIGTTWNILVIDGFRIKSGNFFHAGDAFCRSNMGQCRCGNNITDCIHPFDIGTVVFIHLNASVFDGDPHLFKAYSFGIRGNSHGREHHFRINQLLPFFCFDGHLTEVTRGIHLFNRRAGHYLHSQFLEGALELFAHFLVFERDDVGQEFHQGYLCTD